MKIELELPDWVEGRRISILAGMEQVAVKLPGQPWRVKAVRCGLCGRCCQDCSNLKERHGYKQPNGEWAMMCERNEARPYHCCVDNGSSVIDKCVIEWKEIK